MLHWGKTLSKNERCHFDCVLSTLFQELVFWMVLIGVTKHSSKVSCWCRDVSVMLGPHQPTTTVTSLLESRPRA